VVKQLLKKNTLISNDIQRDIRSDKKFKNIKEKINSALISPIYENKIPVGVIALYSSKKNFFTENDKIISDSMSNLVESAIISMYYETNKLILNQHEEIIKGYIRTSLDGIIITDHNLNIINFNPSSELIFGYSSSEVLNKSIINLIISERFCANHNIKDFNNELVSMNLNKHRNIIGIKKDKTEINLDVVISVLEIFEKPIYYFTIKSL